MNETEIEVRVLMLEGNGRKRKILCEEKILLFERRFVCEENEAIRIARHNEEVFKSVFAAFLLLPEGVAPEVHVVEGQEMDIIQFVAPRKPGTSDAKARKVCLSYSKDLQVMLGG